MNLTPWTPLLKERGECTLCERSTNFRETELPSPRGEGLGVRHNG